MSNESYNQIMKILKEEKKLYDKEQKAKKAAAKKEAKKFKKDQSALTKYVKKSGHQSPNSLECNSPKNMYYSEQQTKDYLAGTSYMDTYRATCNDWD